jgi:hypothetical protein
MDSGQHQQRANQLYRRLLSDIGDYPHWKLSDVLTLIRHGVSEASLEAEWRTMFKIYIDQFTTLERADNLHKSIVDDYGKRDDNHDQMIERANELRERLKKHFGSDFKVTDERLMEYFRLKMPDEAIVRHYWWKVAQSLQVSSE